MCLPIWCNCKTSAGVVALRKAELLKTNDQIHNYEKDTNLMDTKKACRGASYVFNMWLTWQNYDIIG